MNIQKIKDTIKGWWPPWPFNRYGPWKKPQNKKEFSWKREVTEWATAFIAVAIVYFVVLPAVLGTSVPMVVVSSCSEKGYLNTGDVLVLTGINIEDLNAPEIELDELSSFDAVFENGEVTRLIINEQAVDFNRSNDIIVYAAHPSGAQIIHKIFVKLKTPNGYLMITKGDANSLPDQMAPNGQLCINENFGNCISTPISQKMLIGKASFGIPLLGHIKLFFCDLSFNALCEGHANMGTGYNYVLSC